MHLTKSLTKLCAVILAIASVGLAADVVVFECDFENGSCPSEIPGAGAVVDSQGFSPWLGDFLLHNDTGSGDVHEPETLVPGEPTVLSLTDLPPHVSIAICFDLAVIDSWDGSEEEWGNDYFNVAVDGELVFRETISNFVDNPQTFVPAQSIVQYTELFGDPEWCADSLYALVEYTPHSASELTVTFWADGDGWQGGGDESWGIDNIKIIVSIPSDSITGGGWIAQPAPDLPSFCGNYYNVVDAPGITWSDACTWAEALTQGVMSEASGHLVTNYQPGRAGLPL